MEREGVDKGPWLLAPICCGGLLAVIAAALISAIVQTFTSATWAPAYREMVGLSGPPQAEPADELLHEPSEEPAPEV
jgi:hypothetical protein